ncbi:MAG: hypothetical protein ACREBU_13345 [Nitrososphaera sp.]
MSNTTYGNKAMGTTSSYEEKIQNGRIFVANYGHLSPKWQLIELLKQATSIEDGYTSADLASILFPDEVDENGYPTKDAKRKVLAQIAAARPEINGTMILYSLPYRAPPNGHLEHRHFNFVNKDDVEEKDKDLTRRVDALEKSRKVMWATFNKGLEIRNKEFSEVEKRVVQKYRKANAGGVT